MNHYDYPHSQLNSFEQGDNEDIAISRLEKDIETDDGSTDIDLLLEDGTAIEVKKGLQRGSKARRGREIRELTEKMSKFAEKKDNVAIATRGDQENDDVFQVVKENLESDNPGTTVEIMKIDTLSG